MHYSIITVKLLEVYAVVRNINLNLTTRPVHPVYFSSHFWLNLTFIPLHLTTGMILSN